MVEFDRSTLFSTSLLGRSSIHASSRCRRVRGMRDRCSRRKVQRMHKSITRPDEAASSWSAARSAIIYGRASTTMTVVPRTLWRHVLARATILCLRTLDTVLDMWRSMLWRWRRLLLWLLMLRPRTRAQKHVALSGRRMRPVVREITVSTNGVDGRTGRRGDADAVRVVFEAAFDAVTRREESVEALNEVGVASEKIRHTANDAWSIDAIERSS